MCTPWSCMVFRRLACQPKPRAKQVRAALEMLLAWPGYGVDHPPISVPLGPECGLSADKGKGKTSLSSESSQDNSWKKKKSFGPRGSRFPLQEKLLLPSLVERRFNCQGAESQGRSLPLTTLYAHPCIQPLPISASARLS